MMMNSISASIGLIPKITLQIYASQFITSYIILLPFVLYNLESKERSEEK